MKKILTGLMDGYAKLLSPLLGAGKCRFYPTCSAYACEAVEKHGSLRGSILALRRVLSCHPYGRRPFLDPVPSVITARTAKIQKRSSGAKPKGTQKWR